MPDALETAPLHGKMQSDQKPSPACGRGWGEGGLSGTVPPRLLAPLALTPALSRNRERERAATRGNTLHRSRVSPGFLFVLPALAMLAAVMGFPVAGALLQSVNLFGVDRPGFSLSAYARLPFDAEFTGALGNTFLFVALVVAFHLMLGMAVALLLSRDRTPARWLFRVVALLPWTMPDVVGALLWRFMFDTLPGAVNSVLVQGGLVEQPVDWLGDPDYAFGCLVLAEGWRGYPFVMLILLAGLQAVPGAQYEAAAIDGARPWQAFRYVTVPNLRTMLVVALVLDTVWECRLFGMVYGMTGGGPSDATQTLSLLVFKRFFVFFDASSAAAAAVVLAAIMLVVATPYLRMVMRGNH